MDYEDTRRSGYQDREEKDWADRVHIRIDDRGIEIYAVFDGEEQVSEEYAPPQDLDCIQYAEAYSKAKKKYSNNNDE